ncbi:S8 family serine peptidase [Pendulispora rubella]|uniref:S8 family serine peptidase n=1 Tax=Pendulispora rubella TaxID=2741070 RepID=A0ABZ2L347_9BACT
MADDAYDLNGHADLPDGRIAFENNPTSQTGVQGGHGFLNSHIVGGFNNGTGSAFTDANGFHYGLGIAPYARVGITAIFGNGTSTSTAWENTAYGQGARLSTNSWGYTGTAARKYDVNAQEYDVIVRDAQSSVAGLQQYTVVFAAGNSGSGANTVSSPSTAKNVITVGASENVRPSATDGCAIAASGADSADDIISFSSRGPVNSAGGDGRIKPDIVAPGTHVIAGVPQSNYDGSSVCDKYFPAGQTLYGWSSGTSHSTPGIAGAATLVYQDFLNKGRPAPSPAIVKAYLLNSATRMAGVGANDTLPSNNQGWGRVNLSRAFDSVARILVDQTQVLGATGETYTVTGSIPTSTEPFRVTLAWTDAAGPTTGAPWVNNLDLEVSVGGTTYKGNVFSGGNSTSGGTADGKNNVEGVYLPAGTSGNFTVTVRATNIAGDGVPGNADTTDQDFALVLYNATAGTPTEPTIGVSPSSLSFSGTVGGANPANQNVSITNTGGGTLNWSASDNATWLTVSPTSGTAPSTSGASVDIAGLAAGTYNGTITVAATGASNTPVNVPVTLTLTGGGGGSELVTNGGFEGSASPWTLSGDAYHSTGAYPHGGTGYSILGAYNSAAGSEYQPMAIPSGGAPNLTFWLNVSSSETTTTTQYDKLYVEVLNSSGTVLGTLATFSNLNKAAAGTYTQRGPYSLSAYAGQTVRLQFRATTDSSLVTSFRVDDVSVK